MNDDQMSHINDLIKEMEGKDTREVLLFLRVSTWADYLSTVVGIILIVLSMLVPTLIMFFAAGFIVYIAAQVSIVSGIIRRELKNIVKKRLADK
jgi:uncharacterized membrane protein YesL